MPSGGPFATKDFSTTHVEPDINGLIGLIVRGDVRRIREILNNKPELGDEREDSSFNTPLHVACSRGQRRNSILFIVTFMSGFLPTNSATLV